MDIHERMAGIVAEIITAHTNRRRPVLNGDEVDLLVSYVRDASKIAMAERDALAAKVHDLESFRGDVMAGCDIERNGKLYRQVEVVVAGAKLRACEGCKGPGPCLWDPPTSRYCCVNCHSDHNDALFVQAQKAVGELP